MTGNLFGVLLITATCGHNLTNVGNDLPTAADDVLPGGKTDETNLVETELTDAPKDVLLIVTHGL